MERSEIPAVVSGSTTTVRTMADGTLRVNIDIDPPQAKQAFDQFGAPGTPVAIARMDITATQQAMRRETIKSAGWGHVYEVLYTRGWFHNPRVAAAFAVPPEATPQDRIDHIKHLIYSATGHDSFTLIEPMDFVAVCDDLFIGHTLPAEIKQAAEEQL